MQSSNIKKKVIIITNRLVIGGMAIEILSLAYYLQESFEITILYGEKQPDEKEIQYLFKSYPGLTLKKIPSLHKRLNMLYDYRSYRSISKELKANNYHVVHTHGSKAGFLGRLAAYLAKTPCIIHTYHGHFFHSYFNFFFSRVLVATERKLAKITDNIIVTSEQQKEDICVTYKICPPGKILVIHLGIDAEVFLKGQYKNKPIRSTLNFSEDTIAIGIIARVVPVKNFAMFTNIAESILRESHKKIKFFVIGDGIMKEEIQYMLTQRKILWCSIESYTDKANVVFTSWVENVAPLINAMDIVILTSHNEGTALALIEAQLCGKPVVATNVGGVRDTFKDKETGFLVEAGNVANFVSKLKTLVEDKLLREEMGRKATQFALARFDKKAEVEKTMQLYNTCIKNRS